jgi:CspA family cold shock protein
MQDKKKGTVKWFNDEKGYGFIRTDGVTEDIFVHYSKILMQGHKSLEIGQTVEFDISQSDRGLQAANVRVVV